MCISRTEERSAFADAGAGAAKSTVRPILRGPLVDFLRSIDYHLAPIDKCTPHVYNTQCISSGTHWRSVGGGDVNARLSFLKARLAPLSQMRRKNKNADTRAHGAGRFPPVLPEVQIYLCDPFSERKNRRNSYARRLDAVQTEKRLALRLFSASAMFRTRRMPQ